MLETKIARYGNSLTVRVPAALARDLELREGDRVRLRRVKNGLVVERAPGNRLAARLATIREPEAEIRAGRAAGAESAE